MNERIKKLRKAIGLTQQEFADRIGVKRNTIANYEIDRNEPSGSVVSLICKEFSVSENWLRTGVGEMFVPTTRDEQISAFVGDVLSGEADSFKRRFVSMLSRLDTDDWAALENMLDKMKKD
jgi:HTH-type transcriptional regulator/antitoxin PezA